MHISYQHHSDHNQPIDLSTVISSVPCVGTVGALLRSHTPHTQEETTMATITYNPFTTTLDSAAYQAEFRAALTNAVATEGLKPSLGYRRWVQTLTRNARRWGLRPLY